MRNILILFLSLSLGSALAQPPSYTIANTHSHNDYEQRIPFWLAYDAGFGSIEADIWLRPGKLLIGHDTNEIRSGRTLEEYYIRPLDWLPVHPLEDPTWICSHLSRPYADTFLSFSFLSATGCTQVKASPRGSPDWRSLQFTLSSVFFLHAAGSRLSRPFNCLRERIYFKPHPFPEKLEVGVHCSSDSSYSYKFTVSNQRACI